MSVDNWGQDGSAGDSRRLSPREREALRRARVECDLVYHELLRARILLVLTAVSAIVALLLIVVGDHHGASVAGAVTGSLLVATRGRSSPG